MLRPCRARQDIPFVPAFAVQEPRRPAQGLLYGATILLSTSRVDVWIDPCGGGCRCVWRKSVVLGLAALTVADRCPAPESQVSRRNASCMWVDFCSTAPERPLTANSGTCLPSPAVRNSHIWLLWLYTLSAPGSSAKPMLSFAGCSSSRSAAAWVGHEIAIAACPCKKVWRLTAGSMGTCSAEALFRGGDQFFQRSHKRRTADLRHHGFHVEERGVMVAVLGIRSREPRAAGHTSNTFNVLQRLVGLALENVHFADEKWISVGGSGYLQGVKCCLHTGHSRCSDTRATRRSLPPFDSDAESRRDRSVTRGIAS